MRTVDLTVPVQLTDELLGRLRELELAGLRLQRDASLEPPGDVITVQVINERLGDVMRILDGYGLGEDGGVAMSTSVPLSVVTPAFSRFTRESGATTWEELELSIGEDSTMTRDRIMVMFLAGVIAAAGIVADTLHAVVGAMIIAPGFQPFSRVVLGLVARSHAWRGGSIDVLRAYGALLLGATGVALLSRLLGASALDAGHERYLGAGALVSHWTSFTWTGLTVGAAAAVCGGILVMLNRTVLTAGVMVALALVPTASLTPMALVAGDPGLAARAGLRFLTEVTLVLVGTAVAFLFKRHSDQRAETG